MHCKTSEVRVTVTDDALFVGVPSSFTAMRYHSLVLDSGAAAQSKALTVTARSDDGQVMAVTLTGPRNVYGVQFHPESYFSEEGEQLVSNFLKTR
jgi:anthranilate synthase/phosphoribosyltransferase